jgi:hypothetical protein
MVTAQDVYQCIQWITNKMRAKNCHVRRPVSRAVRYGAGLAQCRE